MSIYLTWSHLNSLKFISMMILMMLYSDSWPRFCGVIFHKHLLIIFSIIIAFRKKRERLQNYHWIAVDDKNLRESKCEQGCWSLKELEKKLKNNSKKSDSYFPKNHNLDPNYNNFEYLWSFFCFSSLSTVGTFHIEDNDFFFFIARHPNTFSCLSFTRSL